VCAFVVSVSDARAYVYWSDHGPFLSGTGTTLGRGNLDGSGVNGSFVTGAAQPGGMAVDGGHIYWANGTSIGRANLDGSGANPSFIATGGTVADIATDGTFVWWTDASRYVGRANIDGSGTADPHCIDAGASSTPAGIAVASGTIYLAEPSQIAHVAAGCNGTPTTLATISPTLSLPPFGLTVANGYVYFPAGGAIDRVLTSGGPPQAYVTGLGFPTGVAIDATYLYWADNSAQEIGRAPLSNPSNPQLSFISDSAGPLGIAVDAGVDPTTTSVSCTPSSVAPDSTTACKATVTDSASSAAPSGMVVFSGNSAIAFIGGSSSCTLSPDGSGGMSCVVGAVPTVAGTAPIKATYLGDAAHAQSHGAANVCVGTTAQCGPSSQPPPAATTAKCVVPKVARKSLTAAEKLIKRAGCAIGRITRPRARRGKKLRTLIVRHTNPAAGKSVAKGTRIAILLVQKPKPASKRK
jgi:virginiamycin B lyase